MYSKVKVNLITDRDVLETLSERAIKYGFDSLSSYLNQCMTYVLTRNDEVITKIEKAQRERYYQDYNELLYSYFDTEQEQEILRRAHFYYTSKEAEVVENEQITHRVDMILKCQKARETIAELFQAGNVDETATEPILDIIDASIEHLTTTRGQNKKEFTDKMNRELDRLEMSGYKRKQILSSFSAHL